MSETTLTINDILFLASVGFYWLVVAVFTVSTIIGLIGYQLRVISKDWKKLPFGKIVLFVFLAVVLSGLVAVVMWFMAGLIYNIAFNSWAEYTLCCKDWAQ